MFNKNILVLALLFFVLVCFSGVVSAASFTDQSSANTYHPYKGKVVLKDVTVQTGTQYGYGYKLVITTIGKVVSYSSSQVKIRCKPTFVYNSPVYSNHGNRPVFYITLTKSAKIKDKTYANTNNPYLSQAAYHRTIVMTQKKKGKTWKTIATVKGKVTRYDYLYVVFKCTKLNKLYVSGKYKKQWRGSTYYATLPRYA